MTYFEFLIASCLGVNLERMMPTRMRKWDYISLQCAEVFFILVMAFPVLILVLILWWKLQLCRRRRQQVSATGDEAEQTEEQHAQVAVADRNSSSAQGGIDEELRNRK